VVLQGEPGDCFYLVVSGRASAVIDGNEVKEYNSPGEFFGERSLIRDENRAATVTVVSEEGLEVLYLKREDFTALLGSNVDFTRMESEYRQAFSSVLQGITQGDAGAEGVDNSPSPADVGDAESPAKVHRPSIWSAAGSKVMEDFSAKRGSCRPSIWGETDGKGGASLLSSSAAAELTESSADEDEGLQGLSMGPVSERKEKGDKASSVVSKKVSDYEVVGTLGRGTFGHVQLVQDKQGHMYALKAINKQHIVDNEQVSHLKYERDVMLELGDFPFVVKLWGTMQDKNFVYLLLEPSQGGEVFSLLTDKGQLDKTTAQFYAASVILAFQYMHERDILYRDLKPENLLLDTNGYLRVTDFGFAKKTTERTYTFCGTPDYLSPEIVSNAGHGPGADWWTLGVFIFEMLTGQTPFFDDAGPSEMYNKILAREFSFPLFFDEDARDLINGLLDLKPTKRYGVLKEPNIREHKWFEGFDWDALIAGTMEAPFVRPVKSKFDLSHFDADSDDDDGFDEEFEADSDEEDPFIGF
jgi:serine/threonine protein kinase